MIYHFIAIGGSAMHNLAIALHLKGDSVSGSDDEIFSPSKERLDSYNLLPKKIGWDAQLINDKIDAIILGMHARADNPELLKAQLLNLPIYSYPEFIYEQTKNQIRVVIGGSHGKTSITSMILHVLKENNIDHNFMVGAQLEGFECMVKLNDSSKIAVLEGDEYLSSPIDRRPKFHLYHPNIAVISGIAWDHINVFPTLENYIDQFRIFAESVSEDGSLFYCQKDLELLSLIESGNYKCNLKAYQEHNHNVVDGITNLINNNELIPIEIFGIHNLQNLRAAQLVCNKLGVENKSFYKAIKSFKGASKRLELVIKNDKSVFYKDFAHSPSKLKATTTALQEQFPNRSLIACMELHTFSSLNKEFLKLYHNSMAKADEAIVYFNKETIKHKKLEELTENDVQSAFGTANLKVFTSSNKLLNYLKSKNWKHKNLLMMSSGNFDGIDFNQLGVKIIN
jgi:UDP-N-acetylmuramate: L-alanyl-gamma-D-glutamyl-meso-diaminopimelate ligase